VGGYREWVVWRRSRYAGYAAVPGVEGTRGSAGVLLAVLIDNAVMGIGFRFLILDPLIFLTELADFISEESIPDEDMI